MANLDMSINHWRQVAPPEQHRSLYSADGRRKYLNMDERRAFVEAAASEDYPTRTLCLTLAYTGCRISEALALRVFSIQPGSNLIAIRSLKKRGRVAIREVPVPDDLIRLLTKDRDQDHGDVPLWSFGRTFAWQKVKEVMSKANISGLHASPRGLRHGFAVAAVLSCVPITLVQKWLGHATVATTAIYADVVGPEERQIAQRMWDLG